MAITLSKENNLNAQKDIETEAKTLISNAASRIKSTPPGGVNTEDYEQLDAIFFYENTRDLISKYGMGDTLKDVFEFTEERDDDIYHLVYAYLDHLARQTECFAKYYLLNQYKKRIMVFDCTTAYKIVREDSVMAGLMLENMQKIIHSTPADHCLRIYLAGINYNFSTLAAPTLSSNGSPISFIVSPVSDFFIPPKCNMFFSDQVSSAGYSKNMLRAPTRVSATDGPKYMEGLGNKESFMKNVYVSPGLGRIIVEPGSDMGFRDGDFIISPFLTYEEHVRGIKGQELPLSNHYTTALLSEKNLSKNKVTKKKYDVEGKLVKEAVKISEEEANKLYMHYQRLVDLEFDNAKLRARSFNVQTSYSPYRMVGLPGIYIDTDFKESMPIVMGQIATISSTLDAQGSGSSSVQFMKPRII